jgi:hypothetical protein
VLECWVVKPLFGGQTGDFHNSTLLKVELS